LPQFWRWRPEYCEALAFDQLRKSLGVKPREGAQVCDGGRGICVALKYVNRLLVVTDESLVDERTTFAPRRFNHVACKIAKGFHLTRFYVKLNVPRDLATHVTTSSRFTTLQEHLAL